jgi:hypothetical protein
MLQSGRARQAETSATLADLPERGQRGSAYTASITLIEHRNGKVWSQA